MGKGRTEPSSGRFRLANASISLSTVSVVPEAPRPAGVRAVLPQPRWSKEATSMPREARVEKRSL